MNHWAYQWKVEYIIQETLPSIDQSIKLDVSTFEELSHKSVCIHRRNIQKVAIEMFKVKNGMCPGILLKMFSVNSNPRSSGHFHRPNIKTVYKGDHSLRCFSPIVWDTMVSEKSNQLLHL